MSQDKQDWVSSPRRTAEVMKSHGFSVKKSLGQNFLVDPNILDKIVDAAELTSEKGAIEVGPGIGALTQRLASTAGKVMAIEIDQRLIPILEETLAQYPNTTVVHGDILEVDLPELCGKYLQGVSPISVVANLPYYITTPILMKLLESRLPLQHIVVMIQREVAERMNATPGGKEYGSLSVAVQYYAETKLITHVPHTVFIPQPHVESTVIRLSIREKPPVQVTDEDHFFRVVRASFAQRRKTLLNNLSSAYVPKGDANAKERLLTSLQQCGIDPGRRGETLTIHEFADLSNAMLRQDVN
jgi:16S rRNA (adenine1518-N6/adenine1519-N6)-dimethyltransferase